MLSSIQKIAVLALFVCSSGASAYTISLPDSIAPEVVSASIESVLAPGELEAVDFEPVWYGPKLPNVKIRLGKESFQWVRNREILVVGRGRLIVDTQGYHSGRLRNWGYTQSLVVSERSRGRAELPIAFLSGRENAVEIELIQNGKVYRSKVGVRFKPSRPERGGQIMIDPSCSRFNVHVERGSIPQNSWMSVGCRLAYTPGDEGKNATLEIYSIWDNVGQTVRIDDAPTAAASESIWPLRLRSSPSQIRFRAMESKSEMTLRYFIPDKIHYAFLGAGIGPYTYGYNDAFGELNTVTALLTIYGGYTLTEDTRIVFFDATAFNTRFYTDFGLYLWLEQFRFFDRRISLNLLLGGHFILFRDGDDFNLSFSAPQGIEAVFTDFLFRRYNLSIGSFLYPNIGGQTYYNLWVRFGTGGIFGEINYIAWEEDLGTRSVFSRSFGITVGMPLVSFL